MDEFLKTWNFHGAIGVKEFAAVYFAWCGIHNRPKTKVNAETLQVHGYEVIDGKVFFSDHHK